MEANRAGRGRGRGGQRPDARWEQLMQQQQAFMANCMQQQQAFMTNFIQQQGQSNQAQSHVPPQPPQEDPNRTFHAFLKLQPSKFGKSRSVTEAQSWLNNMTKIFALMQCSEEQKVMFSAHMMEGEAENWWNGQRAYMELKGIPLVWENFKTVFLDNYIPPHVRKQRETEFSQLKQGSNSVAEYVTKFEELSRFSPHATYAPTDQWKIDQFKLGLNPEIKSLLSSSDVISYATIVHRSYEVEEALQEVMEERQSKWQQQNHSKNSQHLKVKNPVNKGKQGQNRNSSIAKNNNRRSCENCGKAHAGECLFGKNTCYLCKQPGHFSNHCPRRKMKGVAEPSNQTTGRVYTLEAKKAKGNTDLIAGMKLQE